MQTRERDESFVTDWNALEGRERRRLRRLVRMGRAADEPELAPLATEYARVQLARPWMRFYWVWFVPGVLMALSIARQLHPVFIGVVIALAAQAVMASFNLRRAARGAATA